LIEYGSLFGYYQSLNLLEVIRDVIVIGIFIWFLNARNKDTLFVLALFLLLVYLILIYVVVYSVPPFVSSIPGTPLSVMIPKLVMIVLFISSIAFWRKQSYTIAKVLIGIVAFYVTVDIVINVLNTNTYGNLLLFYHFISYQYGELVIPLLLLAHIEKDVIELRKST
jgi:hypothetical protein